MKRAAKSMGMIHRNKGPSQDGQDASVTIKNPIILYMVPPFERECARSSHEQPQAKEPVLHSNDRGKHLVQSPLLHKFHRFAREGKAR